MESEVGYGLQIWEHSRFANDGATADALAKTIARATAVNQPGIGAWTSAKDVFGALMNMYHLEYLAQANLVATSLPSGRCAGRKIPTRCGDSSPVGTTT